MRRIDNGGSLRRITVRTDDIGPVDCIFVNFDKYTYQPHGTLVQNEIKIHQQNEIRPTSICNNFHAERALCIPVPACSSWKQKVCNMLSCFLSQLFYSQFDSLNYEDSMVFNSVSRRDDVYMMT